MFKKRRRRDNGGVETTTIRLPRAPLIVGGVVLATLVATAAILAINRGTARYDPATPEGTAQGYLQAVIDGDRRGALSYLTEDLRAGCRVTQLELPSRDSMRVVLGGAFVTGEEAEVDITITETKFEGPFLAERSFETTLVMSRSGSGWAISAEPWPLSGCDVRSTP